MDSQRKHDTGPRSSAARPSAARIDPRRRLDAQIHTEARAVEPGPQARRIVWEALEARLDLPEPKVPSEAQVLWTVPPPASKAANRRPGRISWMAVGRVAAILGMIGGTVVGLALWQTQEQGSAIGNIVVDLHAAHAARARAEALIVDQSMLISEYAREHEVATYEVILGEEQPEIPPDGRAAARALWRQGLAAYVDGDRVAARDFYERALAEDPTFANALTSAGRVAAEDGDLDGAADAFRKALTHQPTYRPAMVNLATILIMRRDLDEAERLIERALATHPDDPVAKRRLERIHRLRTRVVNPKP